MGRPRQSDADAERLTIRLAPELAERIRLLAVRRKVAISALAEAAITQYLDGAEKAWENQKVPAQPASRTPRHKEIKEPQWTPESVRLELFRLGLPQAALARALSIRQSLLSLWLGSRGIPSYRQDLVSVAFKKLASES